MRRQATGAKGSSEPEAVASPEQLTELATSWLVLDSLRGRRAARRLRPELGSRPPSEISPAPNRERAAIMSEACVFSGRPQRRAFDAHLAGRKEVCTDFLADRVRAIVSRRAGRDCAGPGTREAAIGGERAPQEFSDGLVDFGAPGGTRVRGRIKRVRGNGG